MMLDQMDLLKATDCGNFLIGSEAIENMTKNDQTVVKDHEPQGDCDENQIKGANGDQHRCAGGTHGDVNSARDEFRPRLGMTLLAGFQEVKGVDRGADVGGREDVMDTMTGGTCCCLEIASLRGPSMNAGKESLGMFF